ncbi:MAG: tRNA (adenosine(37)-N6)-dimethylallyltransferase MiaA [Candidatus Andersenbacteria bacterium]
MKTTYPPLIAILGPTASGKTAYAIDMAQRINGAIISADSRQVYAGMNIGTAKPSEAFSDHAHNPETPDIISEIPHYLLNITSPEKNFTLSDWLASAHVALQEIKKSGKTPIITGGTMLYVDALLDGYDIPDIEPNIKLREELEEKKSEELYGLLIEEDPEACLFIEPHNTRRIIRALEVISATGKKFSELRKASSPSESNRIGIFPDWDIMRTRVGARSNAMITDGLMEEAVALRNKFPDSPLLQTINYKEALMLADNTYSKQEALEKMTQSTLRYAHRQMSWWNRRSDISWVRV